MYLEFLGYEKKSDTARSELVPNLWCFKQNFIQAWLKCLVKPYTNHEQLTKT